MTTSSNAAVVNGGQGTRFDHLVNRTCAPCQARAASGLEIRGNSSLAEVNPQVGTVVAKRKTEAKKNNQAVDAMKGETDFTEADIPPGRNCVRVFGVKRDLFVEFDFIAGDPTLQVELVLPFPAFQEFCSINDVKALPVAEEAQESYERLCWRFGARPGRPDDVLAR